MNKFWGHLCTIARHRHEVIKNCFRAGIPWRGLMHDLSKYSPTEFWEGVRFYQDGRRSPTESAREINGYSAAWIHHKGINRHHFEHWTDYDPVTKTIHPVKMPRKYVVEMFCDRVAASKIYKGDAYTDDCALAYFLHSQARDNMHPKTAKLLRHWLEMLAREGEEKTFAHIRKIRHVRYGNTPGKE